MAYHVHGRLRQRVMVVLVRVGEQHTRFLFPLHLLVLLRQHGRSSVWENRLAEKALSGDSTSHLDNPALIMPRRRTASGPRALSKLALPLLHFLLLFLAQLTLPHGRFLLRPRLLLYHLPLLLLLLHLPRLSLPPQLLTLPPLLSLLFLLPRRPLRRFFLLRPAPLLFLHLPCTLPPPLLFRPLLFLLCSLIRFCYVTYQRGTVAVSARDKSSWKEKIVVHELFFFWIFCRLFSLLPLSPLLPPLPLSVFLLCRSPR